jgi:hypothetical protein
MAESTTTLDLPIPEPLLRCMAEATEEALDVLWRLELVLRSAHRLRAAVEVFALEGGNMRPGWEEQSGYDDLASVIQAIQAGAEDFTQSLTEPMTWEQRRELVDTVREHIADRLSGLDR